MAESEAWVWFKPGNHVDEGHGLCQTRAAETHDHSLTAETYVRHAQRPDGSAITFILADGACWREQMRVHPNGWRGLPWSAVVEHYDL